jgi:hypothetical protein
MGPKHQPAGVEKERQEEVRPETDAAKADVQRAAAVAAGKTAVVAGAAAQTTAAVAVHESEKTGVTEAVPHLAIVEAVVEEAEKQKKTREHAAAAVEGPAVAAADGPAKRTIAEASVAEAPAPEDAVAAAVVLRRSAAAGLKKAARLASRTARAGTPVMDESAAGDAGVAAVVPRNSAQQRKVERRQSGQTGPHRTARLMLEEHRTETEKKPEGRPEARGYPERPRQLVTSAGWTPQPGPGREKKGVRSKRLVLGLRRMRMMGRKQKEPEEGPNQGQPQPRQAADKPAELKKEEELSLRPKGRRQRQPACRRGTSRPGEAKAKVGRRKPETRMAEHEKAGRA